ncbi:MAG: PAS domain-containing protein [Eubacteriales bacterium]|nr:PAS domain-containing protein [Eubacteriales bacterium]
MAEFDEMALDVNFCSCLIDKADNLKVLECDSHFCDFVGIHPSKVKQGKLFLHNVLIPHERESFMRRLCKKNSPYVYINCRIKDHTGAYNFVHCTCHNMPDSTLCHITFADISQSIERSRALEAEAKEMNNLIDLVNCGVCLFKVDQNMHFEVLYANKTCYRFFGTTKEGVDLKAYHIDDLIHPGDRSLVFQSIGKCMATKKPIDIEVRIIKHRDEYIWCKMRADIHRYEDDNCPVFHAVFSDITDIKKAEAVAGKQSEMLVKVLKNVPGPIFCTEYDTPLVISVAGEYVMELIGYSRDELLGKYKGDLTNLMQPEQAMIVETALSNQLDEGKVASVTYTLHTKSGRELRVTDMRKAIDFNTGERLTIGMLRAESPATEDMDSAEPK